MIKPWSFVLEVGRKILAWVYRHVSTGECLLTELPLDVSEKIVERLSLRDHIRLDSVCKSWRKFAEVRRLLDAPWLLLLSSFSNVERGKVISFYSMSDDCYIDFDLPNSVAYASGWCCCASSNGWLLIATEPDSRNHQLFLLDPLSGVTLNLPSLRTLSFFNEFMATLEPRYVVVLSMIEACKVFYPFGDRSSDLVVAVVFTEVGPRSRLAVSRPNDKEWTIFDEDSDIPYFYSDMFFYKGTLYASRWLDEMQEEDENIVSDHAIFMDDSKCLKLRLGWDFHVKDLCGNTTYKEFLVESIDGELLRVIQYFDISSDCKTKGFDIFKYENKEKLMSLGDQVLFVGNQSASSSISARNSDYRFQRNLIYYESTYDGEFREFGAFDVEHKRIAFSFQYTMNQEAPAFWFTPNHKRSSS